MMYRTNMDGAFTAAAVGLIGGNGYLDGIITIANSAVIGIVVPVIVDGVLKFYQLRSGTDEQSLPEIVRPLDFNENANAVVWKVVL